MDEKEREWLLLEVEHKFTWKDGFVDYRKVPRGMKFWNRYVCDRSDYRPPILDFESRDAPGLAVATFNRVEFRNADTSERWFEFREV